MRHALVLRVIKICSVNMRKADFAQARLPRFGTGGSMKRVLSILLIILTLAFTVAPIASGQTRRHRRVRHGRTFWQKHRDKLTVAGTTAAGAGIGALANGKKGALIGTAAGAGTGALYTYKLRKRHRHRRY
jgi:hypothetical protein